MMEKLKIAKVKNVQCLRDRGETYRGTLHLTSHHLIFSTTVPASNSPVSKSASPVSTPALRPQDTKPQQREEWITYHIIAQCTFRPTPKAHGLPSSIRLRGRDFTFRTFNFEDPIQARDVFETIKSNTCRLGSVEKLYAFSYKGTPLEQAHNGWEFYDARAEWKRQGISAKNVDKGWRISTINSDYKFSPTYPELLVVPTAISDNVINYAGKYRSKVRIPALTYLHPVNNCSITRSSQPMAGLRNNRSAQDERLLAACFAVFSSSAENGASNSSQTVPSASVSQTSLNCTNGQSTDKEMREDNLVEVAKEAIADQPHVYGSQQHNLIVDARPSINAIANQAAGAGSENMDNYKFAAKVYLGIDNIHVMRDSLAKVVEAVKDSDLSSLPPNRDLLAKSGWLKHITALLDGSALIARQVGIQHSNVLIHCSDGWDRTSQLSALSQIMLDPYYRTLEGFIVLVEKDWLAFGHMFAHRTGPLSSEKWFNTQNDGLAGSAIQPGAPSSASPVSIGGDTIGDVFAGAKRFFTKKSVLSDEFDSDGEPIPTDELKARGNGKETLANQEATKPKETSPVFHQFLDCTWQLLRQYPTRFEFNEYFLKRLLYHLYSCQYGTFLYNNEKARVRADVKNRTRSVWDFFLAKRAMFVNDDWDQGVIDEYRGKERLILPTLSKIRWWNDIFGRTNAEMNGYRNTTSNIHRESSENGGTGVITGVEAAGIATGTGLAHKALSGFPSQSSPEGESNAASTPVKASSSVMSAPNDSLVPGSSPASLSSTPAAEVESLRDPLANLDVRDKGRSMQYGKKAGDPERLGSPRAKGISGAEQSEDFELN